MRHLWQWFCGYVCVLLKGNQINRFLNLCTKNEIFLWHTRFEMERALRVHIRLSDVYQLKPLLKKTRTKMRIVDRRGFPFWCHRHPYLKWMPVLLCVLMVLLVYSMHFIWQINISGNSQITTRELKEYLSEQKIDVGIKSKTIDCSNVEYLLREKFDKLSWVSVYIERTTLCIDIKETLYDPYAFSEDTILSYDLIAEKDATIASIITRNGKALVKAGDKVKKGDILVKGQCEIFDDAGERKDMLYVKADATIHADTKYTFLTSISEIEIVALKLAKSYNDKHLYFLAEKKFDNYIKKMQENGVIILNKNVIIDRRERNILFLADISAREQIGINIPVEDIRENELE